MESKPGRRRERDSGERSKTEMGERVVEFSLLLSLPVKNRGSEEEKLGRGVNQRTTQTPAKRMTNRDRPESEEVRHATFVETKNRGESGLLFATTGSKGSNEMKQRGMKDKTRSGQEKKTRTTTSISTRPGILSRVKEAAAIAKQLEERRRKDRGSTSGSFELNSVDVRARMVQTREKVRAVGAHARHTRSKFRMLACVSATWK